MNPLWISLENKLQAFLKKEGLDEVDILMGFRSFIEEDEAFGNYQAYNNLGEKVYSLSPLPMPTTDTFRDYLQKNKDVDINGFTLMTSNIGLFKALGVMKKFDQHSPNDMTKGIVAADAAQKETNKQLQKWIKRMHMENQLKIMDWF
jgi:hypothetical protein